MTTIEGKETFIRKEKTTQSSIPHTLFDKNTYFCLTAAFVKWFFMQFFHQQVDHLHPRKHLEFSHIVLFLVQIWVVMVVKQDHQ